MNSTVFCKLKSNKGASLSWSLLMFLICAVVSSVILAAGTAASGRMSDLAAVDQKYYSLMSAADLLKKQIGGKTVVIKQTTEKTEDRKYPEGTLINENSNPTSLVEISLITTTGTTSGNLSLQEEDGEKTLVINEANKNFLYGSLATQAALQIVSSSEAEKSFEITGSGGEGIDWADFTVDVKETVTPDGTITFIITNREKTPKNARDHVAKYKYSMKLVFEADMNERTETDSVDGPIVVASPGSYKYTRTITTTTKTNIRWKLTSITMN